MWQRTRYPCDKTAFNNASKDLKTAIQQLKNNNFQSYLENLSATKETSYSLWKATKKMKRPKLQNRPIKQPDGSRARSDSEKVNTFGEYLKTVFTPLATKNQANDNAVVAYLRSPLESGLSLRTITLEEVQKQIVGLKEGKSPGYDLIDTTLIKHLPTNCVQQITKLFNSCLSLKHFPNQWKISKVIMIPKPGKEPTKTSSYRPISLLPILGKLLEKMLLRRMLVHLENVIPKHQFGFRERHGTIEQVYRITDTINRALKKKYCSAVFIVVAQAFDKVWHEGLLYKIKKFLPSSFFLLLKSYISGRCYEVNYNSETSPLYPIRSGIPQGSILGPVLYLIYTADIPTSEEVISATYSFTKTIGYGSTGRNVV